MVGGVGGGVVVYMGVYLGGVLSLRVLFALKEYSEKLPFYSKFEQ